MANTRFSSRNYQIAPAPVSGYPLFDEFSIVIPDPTVNLVENPSVENDLTGYGNLNGTIARTAAQQRRGVYSILATPSAANQIGGVYYDLDLVEGQTYTLSADFLGTANLEYAFILADPDETITGILAGMWKGIFSTLTYSTSYPISENVIAQKRFRARGCWERPSFVFASDATDTRRLYIVKTSTSTIGPFYTDGWQVEAKAYPTTYVDGDQRGFLRDELAYYWTGAPHASTSVRSASTRSGGKPVSLKSMGFALMAFMGLGMGIVVNRQTNLAYGGSLYEGSYEDNRTFSLVGRFDERSWERLQERESALQDLLNFQTTPDAQPVLLHYMPHDGCKDLRCTPVEIVANYDGGLEGSTTNLHNASLALNFTSYAGEEPSIKDGGNAAAELDFSESVANANYIIERTSGGLWRKVGATALNGQVLALAYRDGVLYAGGDFTTADGATVNYIAKWNGTSWSALGGGLNAGVQALAIAANGDLYAGGGFTNAGGDANADFIARWNGTSWSALGTGVNSIVNDIALDNLGNLYAVGSFTTAGGGAANRIAKWNGSAWSPLDSGINGLNNLGFAVAVSPNGAYVYAGGLFNQAGGNATPLIARWDVANSTWAGLGAGLTGTSVSSIVFGVDGYLYAGGSFTVAGSTPVNNVARWNGTGWSTLSTGLTLSGAGTPVVTDMDVLGNGQMYAAGFFNRSGSVTLSEGTGLWTGSAWLPVDIDLPGSASVGAVEGTPLNQTFLGYNTSGTATAPGMTTVTNNGTAVVSPVVKFKGPGQLTQLLNATTGKTIYFNLTLLPGEIATLTLGSSPTFLSNQRGSMMGNILPSSQLTTWKLIPEDNTISVFMTGTDGNSKVTMEWEHGFFSLANAVARR